jgi:hypothetical protein
MKKLILLHPKSHWRFWYGSASASGSVNQRYRSEVPDPDPMSRILNTAYFSAVWHIIFNGHFLQQCLICRPAESFVSEDAGTEPRTILRQAGPLTTVSWLLIPKNDRSNLLIYWVWSGVKAVANNLKINPFIVYFRQVKNVPDKIRGVHNRTNRIYRNGTKWSWFARNQMI